MTEYTDLMETLTHIGVPEDAASSIAFEETNDNAEEDWLWVR